MVVRVEIVFSESYNFKPWWIKFVINIKEELDTRFLGINQIQEQLTKYNADLIETGRCRYLEFKSGEDATAFILKWS